MTKAKSVVELSLSRFFKRKYSSVSRAISGYYSSRKNNTNREELRKQTRDKIRDFLLESALEGEERVHSFAIDITGNIKKHSNKSEDRSCIHSGSIAGMSIGHYYSVICKKEKRKWMLPITMDRVPHSKNKYEFSVSQIEPILDKVPDTDTSIIVGDSAYSCNRFVHPLSKKKNVVIITRARANKAIYKKYDGKKEGPGRPRIYGNKYSLNKPESLPPTDLVEEFTETTRIGAIHKVRLSFFKGYICRGSKEYKMSEIEMNFVKVEIFKENGEKKYNRDLWIIVLGEARAKVTLKDVYYEYKDRFDIEHLLKFGKSKLLMDKFQSSDPKRDEDFMMFGAISYHILCKASELLDDVQTRPWENKKTLNTKSPSSIFRAASTSDIFDEVYQSDIKQRGIPNEKNIRKSFVSKANKPIMRKARDPTKLDIEIKSRFGKSHAISKTSLNTKVESKENFKNKIFEKAGEFYDKIHSAVV